MNMRSIARNQNGNILFLILLAVALFAALAYAVTSSMRGGGRDAGNENMQAGASDMLNHFAQLDTALTRMQMTGDIKPENISFRTTRKNYDGSMQTAYHNTNCTTLSCQVFDANGGGASDRNFAKYSQPDIPGSPVVAQGYWDIMMLQWPQAGTDLNDVVIRYVYMKPEFCRAINSVNNITATIGATGSYSAANTVANWDNPGYIITTNASAIVDKSVFTLSTTNSGVTYCHVHHLLITR